MKITTLQGGAPTLVRDMDQIFDRFFPAPLTYPGFGFEPLRRAMEGNWMPVLDLTEREKEFIVRAEIPGVPRENLDVHLEADVLTLSGHREQKTTEKDENMLWEEREAGKFIRTLRLPKAVEAARVEAIYADGILTVRIPKADLAVKNKILIKG